MDTSSETSNTAPLDANSAADAFLDHFSPATADEKTPEALEAEALDELTKPKKPVADVEAEPEIEAEAEAPEDEKITVEVDGKTIELTKAQIAENHKNGLRQADYTQT